ncbi:MAG: tetratricopeptide repeat protein [Phycisphaerae bacterium]
MRAARVAIVAAFVMLPVAAAWSQRQVDNSGRLFDANPQLGAGRYNQPRPSAPTLGGNLSATGNIRAGQSLRSFSPIQDPLSFRGGLGSGALSDFIRDSVSVSDRALGRGAYGGAFYDPARTAPTIGYLNGTSASQFDSQRARGVPGLLNYDRPSVGSRYDADAGARWSVPSAVDSRGELSSMLFGVRPRGSVPGPVDMQLSTAPQRSAPTQAPRMEDLASDRRATNLGPLDLRATGEGFTPQQSPLDAVLQQDANRLLSDNRRRPRVDESREAGAPGGLPSPVESPARRDSALRGGENVFTDMQLAVAAQRDQNPDWLADVTVPAQVGKPNQPSGAASDTKAALLEVLRNPLHTFVGAGASAINAALAQAEAALHDGDFYGAAARFDRASAMDPTNPLPLIGRAHALLAAGEYFSASVFLERGLERYPEFSRFALDLEALLGGGEAVDIRRADIMKRLEARDDPQLRFLLGYIEIHTGNRTSGLENLGRAAQSAQLSPTLRLYASRLRQGLEPAQKEMQTPPSHDVPSAPQEQP